MSLAHQNAVSEQTFAGDRIGAPSLFAPRIAPEPSTARAFFAWLYEDGAGYIEIVAGRTNPTDPRKIDLVTTTRRWCYYDPERPDLLQAAAAYAAQLADGYGNVYCGVRLYTADAKRTNTRAEKYTKPSRVIVIDDAPAAPALPYSLSVRTSEHSRHAYYKCDAPTSKDDARRAAAALGGDQSGVDLTQLVRIPGTVNTKGGQRWAVAIEPGDRPVYALDQLRTAFPAVAGSAKHGKGVITDLAWPAVATHLANMGALLASARAKCIKPETQAGRILAGEMLTFAVRDRQDDSRSLNAYVLGNGFYLRGFPDAEIAAVMLYHYQQWGVERDKGTAWCTVDIERALARMHAEKPGVRQSPTRYTADAPAAALVERPAASRARSDRPRQLDALMLFHRYQQQAALRELSRKARAQHLQISTATLDRLDSALRAMGLIEIEILPKRAGSRVLIMGGVINIGADGVLSASDAAIADSGAAITQSADASPQCIGGTHPPPEAPSPAAAPPSPWRLADAVRQAFDLVRVDHATGEKRRITRKRLVLALADLLGELPAPAELDRAIADERQRRRIAAIVADIRTMRPPTLRAQLRLMERLSDKSRAEGTNLHKFADWAARELRQALASRPQTGRKPRPICEALPDLRAAGAAQRVLQDQREQAELWALADRALAQRMPTPSRVAVGAGVCSPNTAAALPPASIGSPAAAGLIARLKARAAAS